MAGGELMIRAVANYLAARRAAGFELNSQCYLLQSFARFAAARGETHIRTATAIDWASRTVSVAQRDARLKAVCRFARYMCFLAPFSTPLCESMEQLLTAANSISQRSIHDFSTTPHDRGHANPQLSSEYPKVLP